MRDPAIIEVEVKNVFGKDLIYPVNADAKLLSQIAGTKTLSLDNISIAVLLGMNIKEVSTNKLKIT